MSEFTYTPDNPAKQLLKSVGLWDALRKIAFSTSLVLREWYRVLKPSGVLRLAVPDFRALVEVYQKYGDLRLILGPLYGRMIIHTDKGESTIYHHTVYDFESLRSVLESAGFMNVRRFD